MLERDGVGCTRTELECLLRPVAGGPGEVIQRRTYGSEEFYRGWTDYKNGFGTLNNEFWLSNINIWRLTNGGCELKVDLEDWEGDRRYAYYSSFVVDRVLEEFTLDVGGYSSGNSLSDHDEEDFSTHDIDNDDWGGGNCAVFCHGACSWWYEDCMYSNLNGEYNTTLMGEGVNWESFRGRYYSLKYTAMKIRPSQSTST